MKLKRHAAAELKRFLVALDHELTQTVGMVVIGGSALALAYGVRSVTSDIDTLGHHVRDATHGAARTSDIDTTPVASFDAVHEAARKAREVTKLDIPIAESTIAQLPPGFEGRLVRVLPELEHLELWVPEVYDLTAAKLLRGNEHDRQQLVELHQRHPLELAVLVERFNLLLANYVGDPGEPRWSLFHLITEIWGEAEAIAFRP